MADTGAKGIREREEGCVWRGRKYMKMSKSRIQSDILEWSLPKRGSVGFAERPYDGLGSELGDRSTCRI